MLCRADPQAGLFSTALAALFPLIFIAGAVDTSDDGLDQKSNLGCIFGIIGAALVCLLHPLFQMVRLLQRGGAVF